MRFYLLFDCFHSDFAHSGKFLMHFNDWCEKFYLESKNIFVYSDTCCNPHYCSLFFKTKLCIRFRPPKLDDSFQKFYKSIQLWQQNENVAERGTLSLILHDQIEFFYQFRQAQVTCRRCLISPKFVGKKAFDQCKEECVGQEITPQIS